MSLNDYVALKTNQSLTQILYTGYSFFILYKTVFIVVLDSQKYVN